MNQRKQFRPEELDEIVRLYKRDIGLIRVGKMTGCSSWFVYQTLKRAGIKARAKGKHVPTCVDCGKPTTGRKRCDYHKKIRDAEMNRLYCQKAGRRFKRAEGTMEVDGGDERPRWH